MTAAPGLRVRRTAPYGRGMGTEPTPLSPELSGPDDSEIARRFSAGDEQALAWAAGERPGDMR